MALQITECRGVIFVNGNLSGGNVNILDRHMSRFINSEDQVILNLERVAHLGEAAAYTFQQLFKKAVQMNAIFSIIGLQNENILPILNRTKTSYILSHDRT